MSNQKHFLCSHLVTLSWGAREASANMEKIWAEGATFNMEQPVEPGVELRVSSPEWQAAGSVAGCSREDDGYLIDLQFGEGYAWSPADFEPKHLTDLDALLVRKLLSELLPG